MRRVLTDTRSAGCNKVQLLSHKLNRWAVPFYLDVGTGQSQSTFQAAGGISYAFHWGEVNALWRYLSYNFKSSKAIEDVAFSGPQIGVVFRW